jgi:hypothetical protein
MSYLNPTGATGVDAVAQQLMQMFDRNRDGQLTVTEFGDVLRELLTPRTPITAEATAATGVPSVTRRTDQLTGFDSAKFDVSTSTKYRFARAAMQFDVSGVKDKAGAEALLQEMRPAMEREGLQVVEISKDRIQVMHEGRAVWIDVIQGAASGSPRFQWLPTD